MSDASAQTTVIRTVELDADPDEVWRALADDAERSAWFGSDTHIEVRPGGSGEVVEPDGAVQRVEVDAVEEGRRLAWRWWPVDGGPASDVEFAVEPRVGGTRLTVTERLVLPAGPQASVAPVGARLLDLELLFLVRVRV